MRVLFITHKYPPIIGGMEKQSYELTTRLGPDHEAITHAYKGEGSKLKWFLNLKKDIKNLLKQNPDIDIIHLNDGLMAAATTWLTKYTKVPVVATIHGLDITFPSDIFQNRIVKKMHRLDAVICVSNATAQACIDRGFSSEKVFTVLNGVDHDLAEMPIEKGFLERIEKEKNIQLAGKKIVMTMGRAVKRKGFSWFLKNVLPKLSDDTIFLMVGPLNTKRSISEKIIAYFPESFRNKVHLMFGIPTDVEAIVEALKNPKTKDKVYHLGKVSFPDLMQYLALADLFVMPNIKVEGDAEGFGLVALEASLRGAPVIAAGIEGITDAVIDGDNGIKLPTGETEIWVETLNSLLADKEKLSTMSTSAISTTLKNYGWDKMVEEYLQAFDQLIQKNRG